MTASSRLDIGAGFYPRALSARAVRRMPPAALAGPGRGAILSAMRFVIRGGRPLSGELRISGNKNAVLPMIAASLLTRDEVVLENVPDIRDVDSMLEIAAHLGVEISREDSTLRLRAARIEQDEVPWELCEKTRTSFLFVAPLLHRVGRAKVYPPGGDLIGRRRLDSHFYGLRKLGCEVDASEFELAAPAGMTGDVLFFDEASVTATEHILMAAVLAKGRTEIRNAASEPHVQNLAELLIAMGAQIEGLNSNLLVVHGVEALHGARCRVEGDHIEAGSFLALAAATGGSISVTGTRRGHYWMIHRVFERFGLALELQADRISLPAGQMPRIQPDAGGHVPRVDDGPWPQFPSDLMSAMVVLATQSEGTRPVLREAVREPAVLRRSAGPDGREHRRLRSAPRDRHGPDPAGRPDGAQPRHPRGHGADDRRPVRHAAAEHRAERRDRRPRLRGHRAQAARPGRRHRARSGLSGARSRPPPAARTTRTSARPRLAARFGSAGGPGAAMACTPS